MARIIVLEDDATTRLLITTVLKKFEHEVTAIDNGAEGLLVVLAEQPDLVITDVMMPKLSGFEVLAEIRQTPEIADTPVILLTSLSSREDMRAGMTQGADDYLTKPFSPAELVASVHTQLERVAHRQRSLEQRAHALAHSKINAIKNSPKQSWMPTQPVHTPSSALKFAQSVAPAWPSLVDPSPEHRALQTSHVHAAWFMHVTVQNQADIMQRLNTRDWRLLLRTLYSPGSSSAALKTASHVTLAGSDLFLVFTDRIGQAESAAVRTAHAVASMVAAARRCKRWAAMHFQESQLPPVRTSVTLHYGAMDQVTTPLTGGGQRAMVLGPEVELAQSLRTSNPSLIWTAVATEQAVAAAPGVFLTGARCNVTMANQEFAVHALMGLGPVAGATQDLAADDEPVEAGVSWV